MKKEMDRLERVDEEFAKQTREIALRNAAISGFMPSSRRITKAIRRHSLWPKLMSDISNTKLEDDIK